MQDFDEVNASLVTEADTLKVKLLGFSEEVKEIKAREDKIDLARKAKEDFDVLQEEIRKAAADIPNAQESQAETAADDLS